MTRANAPGAPPGPHIPVSAERGREAIRPASASPPRLRAAPQPHVLYDRCKRLVDLLLAAILLPPALLVIALAGAAIVLTTGQNPLLLQTRVGLLGQEFRMFKLRTMHAGAGQEPVMDPAGENGPPAKTPDDPRVTPIGRVLRRTSVDELPQLINVLRGEMSLVGPRPALPAEVAEYPASWRRRLSVPPGVTGLWQVSGRSDVPSHRSAAMDRAYIANRSLAFDLLLLLRTVAATTSMRGAW